MQKLTIVMFSVFFLLACGGGPATVATKVVKKPIQAQKLKKNGDLCKYNTECESHICDFNGIGEPRCYGNGNANDPCTNAYDCRTGACFQAKSGYVCAPAVVQCHALGVSDACLDNIMVSCMFFAFCSDPIAEDINNCFAFMCGVMAVRGLTDAQCLKATADTQAGLRTCPKHGSEPKSKPAPIPTL